MQSDDTMFANQRVGRDMKTEVGETRTQWFRQLRRHSHYLLIEQILLLIVVSTLSLNRNANMNEANKKVYYACSDPIACTQHTRMKRMTREYMAKISTLNDKI